MRTVAFRPYPGPPTGRVEGRVLEICAACDVDLCWLCLHDCTCDHRNVSWSDDWTG